VAVVAGLSVLVGFAGPNEGFQWELASIFGTALGTTLLAAATGALAYSTWSDVRATWRLAELTKHDQDERQRPIVLLLGANYEGSEAGGNLKISLRNVGLGPALRVSIWATYRDDDHRPTFTPESYTIPAIAPNEAVPLRLYVSFEDRPETVAQDRFAIFGTFTDRSVEGTYEVITAWTKSEGQDEPAPWGAAWS
jgi:hypothetical protein